MAQVNLGQYISSSRAIPKCDRQTDRQTDNQINSY